MFSKLRIVSYVIPNTAGNWIGLLDIFVFEEFKKNSFEQLCINLTNESLQNHYNIYIFEKDMEECRAEGIDVTEVKCPDNLPCVRLIVDKGGTLALLVEEFTLGKGNESEFLEKFNKRYKIIAGDKGTEKGGRDLAQIILTACDMNKRTMSQIGKTKVFLKAEAFPIMERFRNEALLKFCCCLQKHGCGYLARLRTNHESCEYKLQRLVSLLRKEYRAYVRRSADKREARARWRKKQKLLFREQSSSLYGICAKEKEQMYSDGKQILLTFSTTLEQSIKALKMSQAEREKERQNLMDADMIERERMLKAAAVYIEELRRVSYQERLMFVAMLLEDLDALELQRRCQIRTCEREERDTLWRSYRS
ncbi:Myosin head [Trypanosoma melophagium]|uniref:Myosin head n=1 Tax=Trypanosoma melophagium TaxID=715481 RepID=UPI00351AA63D|nr:Myosin head [Trypanosoma melophagium]